MERGGPCDGLCHFRIHLGTRGDYPSPAGDGEPYPNSSEGFQTPDFYSIPIPPAGYY
uniref:Uncharacterized protein n=1 Tax=Oryza sativa subsp. japonica TaxID=39947 RepID=Q6ERG1_ORYSJ|nr:hypothetical protein [Oryza sativa Japonica Group]